MIFNKHLFICSTLKPLPKIFDLISWYFKWMYKWKKYHEILTSKYIKVSIKNNLEIFIQFFDNFLFIISQINKCFSIISSLKNNLEIT
jgi:hypothetical protein